MADDKRRAYAQSARGEPAAGWGEPSLGGGERESVGERLKRERETYGLHLREVSESLRIRYAYLDAIERSAFDELPGPTYAVGFVRGYAQFLGLDDDRIVQRFKDESQGLKRDQELHFPEPVNEGKIPGGTILVLSIALIAAAYGAWAYLSDGERSVADLVPEVPESLQRMVGATEEPPVPEATDLTGTRTGEPATDETASADPAAGDLAAGEGTAGTAADAGDGATTGDGLESEQVAELPETAPDPDLSGDTGAAADGTQSTAAPDGDTGAPDVPDGSSARAPETAGTDDANGTATQTSTADPASDLPAAPNTDTAAGSDPTAAQDQAAGEPAPDAPELAGDTQTAATPEDAQPDTQSGTQSADRSGQQADAQSGAQAAEGEGNPAPPAVPEMQQDDSGIPTAPDQTQTASAEGAGEGTDGRTFGASPANSRVTLVATARSWVQVRGPDDSLVLTRLLRPGDRYNVPDRQGLTLHTGNAGGLQVMVDGREIGSLGVDGEVRRGILLEPQALAAGG